MFGAKHGTEDVNSPVIYYKWVVEEYSKRNEVGPVRAGGLFGSKNVGMSSKNHGESPWHRKSKVSWVTRIDPGLVGPKARLKGVVDG